MLRDDITTADRKNQPKVTGNSNLTPERAARTEPTISQFLGAFFPDPNEAIHLRFMCPRNGDPVKALPGDDDYKAYIESRQVTRALLANDKRIQKALRDWNRNRGAYFVVNAAGELLKGDLTPAGYVDTAIVGGAYEFEKYEPAPEDPKKKVKVKASATYAPGRFTACFAECDDRPISEQHALLDACPLPPSIRVETKKSVHAYWLLAGDNPGDVYADDWREVQRRLIAYFGSDDKIKNPARLMRLPGFDHLKLDPTTKRNHRTPVRVVVFEPDRRFTLADLLEAFPAPAEEAKAETAQTASGSEKAPKRAKKTPGTFITWPALLAELGRRIRADETAQESASGNIDARAKCHDGQGTSGLFFDPSNNSVHCNRGCDQAAILRAFGLPEAPEQRPHAPSGSAGQTADGETLDAVLTEQGNAEELIRRFGENIRYIRTNREFLTWDGKRWVSQGEAYMAGRAVEIAKDYLKKAANRDTPIDEAKRYASHGRRSLSATSIRNVITLCRNFEQIHVEADAFDPHPHLLNCQNGTVDLRTGELIPHERAHLNRSMIPFDYDPDAQCPTWESSLRQIFRRPLKTNKDEADPERTAELVRYFQRYVGYTATGETSEQTILLLHGSGANGKSKVIEAISAVLGDYAKTTPAATLMMKRHSGVSNDIADMWGARMVSSIETESGSRLAQSLVKSLSGGDRVKARFLFKEYFDFSPRFKIWLAVNHKPVIDGSDEAMIRRVRLVPFEVKFEKLAENPDTKFPRDDKLPEKWKAEYPGILRWIVEGAMTWYRSGMTTPEDVKAATKSYAAEMDSLKAFLENECILGHDYQVKAGDFIEAYTAYCVDNGETPLKGRALSDRLTRENLIPRRTSTARYWDGVKLLQVKTAGSTK